MIYTKSMFGIALLTKLKKEPFDIVKFSRWCERIYSSNIRNIDDELRGILFELSTMEDDSQFERTPEDLQTLAEKLIYEDIELLNVPKALILDEQWLMCSICNEAWEEQTRTMLIVFCPKCETVFINPRFINLK